MSFTHADSPFNKPDINANTKFSGLRCGGTPCEVLTCNEATSPACVVACGAGLVPFTTKCLNTPLAPFSTSFGGGPSAATQQKAAASAPPSPDTDADCNSWGFFKPLCVTGKSAIKGVQSGAGVFNLPGCGVLTPIPLIGQTPCWMIGGGVLAVLAFMAIRRRL